MAQLSVLRDDTLTARRQQAVQRQRHIPRRHQQPPDKDAAADKAGKDEVQKEQGDPTAQRAAARYDPEPQPPDPKRQPAEDPEPEIIQLPVLTQAERKMQYSSAADAAGRMVLRKKGPLRPRLLSWGSPPSKSFVSSLYLTVRQRPRGKRRSRQKVCPRGHSSSISFCRAGACRGGDRNSSTFRRTAA